MVEPRIVATLGLRLAATLGRAPSDPDALARYVSELGAIFRVFIAQQGWHTSCPLPGTTDGVHAVGTLRRALFVAPLWNGREKIGMLLTVVMTGREPSITVAPPNCVLPPRTA